MNWLQKTLQHNAIFSGISGILLVIFHQYFTQLFGIENATVFWIVGAGLIFFSATIFYEIKRQKPSGVFMIIVQDYLWVLGSAIILAFQPFGISKAGNGIILGIALIVLIMGISQSRALAQVDEGTQSGIKQLRFKRTVKASKSETWAVVSDVGNYYQFASTLDDSKILSGSEEGMVRSCSHGNKTWTETCSLWEDEKVYSFEVNTSAPDYPYPFKTLKGTWQVEEIAPNITEIVMIFDFQYKRKFQNWLIHPLLKGQFSKGAEELLDNWQAQLEGK